MLSHSCIIKQDRIKKGALLPQELGYKLFKLPETQIEKIALPEEIYLAVKFAKNLKSRGALKIQLQYIGVLMRNIDHKPIKEALRNIEEGDLRSNTASNENSRCGEEW